MDPKEPAGAPPVVPAVEPVPAAAPAAAVVPDPAPAAVAVAVTVGVGAWCVDAVGRICQITKIDEDGLATVAVDNVLGFSERKVADLRIALAKELPPHIENKVGYL